MSKTLMPSVAVVDRDATACLLMREVCHSGGWNVVGCAQNVRQAMAILAETRPICLITGYKFPGGATGLDLIQRAKRLVPHLFSIIYTGWDINDVAANIAASPPDRILRKPMPPHQLLDLLDGVQSQILHQAQLQGGPIGEQPARVIPADASLA